MYKTDSYEHLDAVFELDELIIKGNKESISLLSRLCASSSDPKFLAYVGAGVLESFLSTHGEQFEKEIKSLAETNRNFAIALNSVWQHGMSDGFYGWIRSLAQRYSN
ncbi:MAG: hypothetical protein Fur003_2830 [Candidatus Dojkabacteria bacterium]